MAADPLSQATKLYEAHGFAGASQILILAIVLAALAYLGWSNRKMMNRLMNPKEGPAPGGCPKGAAVCPMDDTTTPRDLAMHSLFAFINSAVTITIPRLPISDPGRKAVFTTLMDIKLRIVSARTLSWLQQHTEVIPGWSDEELYARLVDLVTEIVQAYEAGARAQGIPEIVIDTFALWHKRRIENLLDEADLISGSGWLKTNYAKIGHFLTHMEHASRTTVLDSERSLRKLNGKLTGQVFRGIVIGPCSMGGYPSEAGVANA